MTAAVLLAGFVLVCVACAVALRRRFLVVTVAGPSMEPTLFDGDRVLVRRRTAEAVRRGDVVVLLGPRVPGRGLSPAEFLAGATNEERALVVKRVAALPGDPAPGTASAVVGADEIVVTGDNEAMSFDSRQAGPLDAREVRGVVVRRIGDR